MFISEEFGFPLGDFLASSDSFAHFRTCLTLRSTLVGTVRSPKMDSILGKTVMLPRSAQLRRHTQISLGT